MPTRPEQMARRASTIATTLGALLTLVCAAPAAAQDTYPRQPGITITHYTFDVVLSDTTDEISMKEVVDLDLSRAGIDGVNLDLCGPRPRGAAAVRTRRSLRRAQRSGRIVGPGQHRQVARPPG